MKKKLLAIALSAQMILSSLATAPMAYASELVTPPTEPTQENVVAEGENTAPEDAGTDGEGSAGTDGEGSAGTDGEGSAGTEGEGSAGTEGEGSAGTEGEGSAGTEGEGSAGTDGEGSAGTEGEGSVGTEGEGSVGTEGEGSVGTEGEGSVGTEGEGSAGTDGEGSAGTEGEGSNPTGDEGSNPTEGETTILEEGEGSDSTDGDDSDSTEESEPVSLTWMPYADFVLAESERAFADPEMYVGYTATFNTIDWDTFCLIPNIDSADLASISLEENTVFVDTDVFPEINDVKVVITDYYLSIGDDDTSSSMLWYKFEVSEDPALSDELAEILTNNPYILYYDQISPPALLIQPKQAMFAGESVTIKKSPVEATREVTLNTSLLPEFFDVSWHVGLYSDDNENGKELDMYDLGDISHWENVPTDSTYRYVDEASIIMIPPEVTVAYEKLLAAKDMDSYMATFMTLPEYVIQMLSEKHFANLEKHMDTLGSKTVETTTTINGVSVPVSVYGPLPEGASLSVEVVADQTVLEEGFPIDNAEDIIAALDIKIMKDGAEWQPSYGMQVAVSIGMKELGYEDGTIVRMHHKHGENIKTLDLFVVMEGTVTLWTDGFSMYVVDSITDNSRAREIRNNGRHTMTVGEKVVFYFPVGNNSYGTWHVTDTEGAIYYTVHGNSISNDYDLNNSTRRIPWIQINALKEGTVTLQYFSGNSNTPETYTLKIESPKAASGQQYLYIKDLVNTKGTIQATLVDEKGNELSLDGAEFSWERSDNLFIIPYAYSTDFSAVNIAVDHGGLTEARRSEGGYVTYTVTAGLADGQVKTAEYTVYYQSEIINANFETPNAEQYDYSFAPNGYEGLYWKTTAPGTGNNRTKDIEIGDVTRQNNNGSGGTDFGVRYAADYDEGGMQFAELNAEEFGALYQDIITAPGEDLEWKFAHAPRPRSSWARSTTNAMFIVIGATEDAQELTTQAQLEALGQEAMRGNTTNTAFLNCQAPVTITYADATYKVWYHNAGIVQEGYKYENSIYNTEKHGWTNLDGTYTVPEGQYRTRVFFVSDPTGAGDNKNSGNLIDKAKAGQYKTFLIEYYEENLNDPSKPKHLDNYDEWGEELIYSTADINGLDRIIDDLNLFLHEVLVNGSAYPFDLRYNSESTDKWTYDDAKLYIQNYKGTAVDPYPDSGKNYADYDIVLQVYLRDTVVAVQKELVFPEAMTTEQKLQLMNELKTADPSHPGYEATFVLSSIPPTPSDPNYDEYIASGTALIQEVDPSNHYTNTVSIDKKDTNGNTIVPSMNTYQLEETQTTNLIGLTLKDVHFHVETYEYMGVNALTSEYTNIDVSAEDVDLISKPFELNETAKIAQIVVTNTYKEKTTRVYYKAIGNGKVKLNNTDAVYEDAPYEDLLFYSGVAVGAVGHEGKGATFEGWYKDEECTVPVTDADGVYDAENHAFKPNANIIGKDENGNYINLDEVTFYAKFVTRSITIERSNADSDQVFVYKVHCEPDNGAPFDMYVSITGNNSCTIYEAVKGTYTVTELTDFTWRYNEPTTPDSQTFADDQTELKFNFNGEMIEDKWLNDFDLEKNVHGNVDGSSPIDSDDSSDGDSGGSGTGT